MKKFYYTIGEVSNLLGIKPHVIRYWESEFTFLKPKKSSGHIRKFDEAQILILRKIHDLLYNQRFTIEGARQKIKQDRESIRKLHKDEQIELDFAPPKAELPTQELVTALDAVRNELLKLKQLCKQYSEN